MQAQYLYVNEKAAYIMQDYYAFISLRHEQ